MRIIKIGIIFALLLIAFISANETNEKDALDQINYEVAADQITKTTTDEPIHAENPETPANIPPIPATDPRPATDPIPATQLHDFGQRDLNSDTVENSYVLLAEGFLKIEFYYYPAIETTQIDAFILSINNGTQNSTLNAVYTIPNLTPALHPTTNRTVIYSSMYWEYLKDDNYTIEIKVRYTEDGSTSPVLLRYQLDTAIHQLCSQESIAAFFALEIYSIVPLKGEYNFCGFSFNLFVEIDVDEGRLAIFYEDNLSLGVITFRGSQTEIDFILDEESLISVSCDTVYDFDCAGNVGLGYAISYNALKDIQDSNLMNFTDQLGLLKEIHNTNFILLTGHSKGAAEASLAALDVITTDLFYAVHITTFGFPSYADEDFAEFWNGYVNPSFDLDDIRSTWHYHMDSIGHRDIVVYTPIETYGKFPFRFESRYFDRNCNSDVDCHRMLLYPSSVNISGNINVTNPNAGYYFVGADPNYYGYQSDLYLSSFPVIPARTRTPTASKSLTPSMFSTKSTSLSRTPSKTMTPSNFSSRSPTRTRTPTPAQSTTPFASRTRSRTPTPSIFSSPSTSTSPHRSATSSPSFLSSLSSTKSTTPTKTTTHPSPSPSTSTSATPSLTKFFSQSNTPSRSAAESFSPSRSEISQTPAPTSPTITQSTSLSSSNTPTISHTSSNTKTPSPSAVSLSPTNTRTSSRQPSTGPEPNSALSLFSVNFCLLSISLFFFAL